MAKFLSVSRAVQGSLLNESIAAQVVNAADTYLTGSQIAPVNVPARSHFVWKGWMTKSAAGVAAPSFKIRVGTAGTIVDTARVTLLSSSAQTAVVDSGCFEITAMLRAIGASAVIAACLRLGHDLQITGFAIVPSPTVIVAGAAFDLAAIANPFFGLSVDPGAAGVWTFEEVIAEMKQT